MLASRLAREGSEVKAALALVHLLLLEGCTVTADALHAHADFAQAGSDQGGGDVLAREGARRDGDIGPPRGRRLLPSSRDGAIPSTILRRGAARVPRHREISGLAILRTAGTEQRSPSVDLQASWPR